MKLPNLTAPRFRLVNRVAQSVLAELGYPPPPIRIEKYLEQRKWKIRYEELEGPDGYMVKLIKGNKCRYIIFLATDIDIKYDEQTMRRRQLFTKVHELGHILLHGQFLLNSHSDMSAIPDYVAGIMEVEAHWFASRVLMPNYIFNSVADLSAQHLSDKCDVNITAANKRINNLAPNIRDSLISSARLDEWPPIEEVVLPEPPLEAKFATWVAYEESAAAIEETERLLKIKQRLFERRYEAIWKKNEDMLDRYRRMYGYE
ncbi:ImmA/IrrE family metallo-endopeptidase [Cohnella cholangitidis]|uniref:ImmA/IrrE family metallo-endopeptidase n=1 Tax=Cohnella cholangitidis TaxID=2598458 RepID=A0A7G5C3D0_9BACL|nr:ImmA/IrrE family metallo-endopeptidase [Cohnella cholangitidis]QMV43714.1 ImmA/IrrE family metallo-endopeptidase [Cohnella cholangitidis]